MEMAVHLFAFASGVLCLLACQRQAKFFNPALLEIDHPVDVDIHQFNRANNLPAGNYKVDIHINGEYVERREVTFADKQSSSSLASPPVKPAAERWGKSGRYQSA
jgi:outer membrane usher protein